MNVAMNAQDTCLSHSDFCRESDLIFDDCVHHPAMVALESFNARLSTRALSVAELTVFLASLAAFNRHTVGGIAILAGRLSDQLLPHRPLTAHQIGAYVLDAAVDEYGLRESKTHLELAREFANHLGVSNLEVDSRSNACAGALALGDSLYSWYRESPAAFALGVHVASEVTSMKEFFAWHDIFLKFPQYRLSMQTPEFEYMRAHFVHEPDHMSDARVCIGRYLEVLPGQGVLLREGAEIYLREYQRMFHEMDSLIFK
jgi:hypothetical protein